MAIEGPHDDLADYDVADEGGEVADFNESDGEELWLTFETAPAQSTANAAASSTAEASAASAQPSPDDILQRIAVAAEEEAATVGLAEATSASASNSSGATRVVPSVGISPPEEAGLAPPAQAAEALPEGIVGPSAMGYVLHDGKSVMRILRGNPKNSMSVKCYRHPSCSFLLPLRLAPSDEDLVRWLFAVPEDKSASAEVRKQLAGQHVALANKWKQPAARKAKAGAASSSTSAGPAPTS